MTALSIQIPYPVFTDRVGQPLENGYVWIGQPNLNPQTNPVTVYLDEALTIPVAQPLRTIGGYVSNAGTPAQLYINGVNFSILVQDSKGTQVYNFPDGSGISPDAAGVTYNPGPDSLMLPGGSLSVKAALDKITDDGTNAHGASLISFLQAGTGAVSRTTQSKLREAVSVRDFGAVGDGVTDDTLAIQKAIDAVAAAGPYGVVTIPQSSGEYIASTILVKEGVTLRGEGGVLKWKSNTCVNPAATYYFLYNLGHNNVTYENLVIDGNRANNTQWLVADSITATGDNVVVRGCRIYNTPDSGVMFSDATNGRCVDNWIDTGGDLGVYMNAPEVTPARGDMVCSGNVIRNFPYGGIGIKRSVENGLVSNNLITQCGNGITVEDFGAGLGGAPDHLLITGNLIQEIGYPFSSDPLVSQVGVTLNGCSNVVLSNNKLQNISGNMIFLSGTVDSLIQGNHCVGYPTAYAAGDRHGILAQIRSGVSPSRNNIVGNIFRECKSYGIRLEVGTGNIIDDNIIQCNSASGGTGIRIDSTVTNCTVSYNRITAPIDTQIFAGASEIVLKNNYLSNGSTAWERDGNVRSIAVADPNGAITPFFPAQLAWITSAGPKIFMSIGTSNNQWVQIGGPLFNATATQIASAASSINTVDKYVTKQIWDTTNMRLMFAQGDTPTAPWYVVDGSAFVTPV